MYSILLLRTGVQPCVGERKLHHERSKEGPGAIFINYVTLRNTFPSNWMSLQISMDHWIIWLILCIICMSCEDGVN